LISLREATVHIDGVRAAPTRVALVGKRIWCGRDTPRLDHLTQSNEEFHPMQLTDILAQTGGLQSMERELGLSKNEATTGAAALLPAILGGFKKKAQTQSAGPEGLGGLLGQLGGGALLDDVLSPTPTDVNRGNNVLGQIFGSKDVSRAVAQNAASQSGLDPAILKKMLPVLAMLVTGYLAKQRGAGGTGQATGGGLGGMLGGLVGKRAGQGSSGAAGSGASGLPSMFDMLDTNKDGNPLDDILRMVGNQRT
jgi:hypothetical protein